MSQNLLKVRDEKAFKSEDWCDVDFIQRVEEATVSLLEIVNFILLDDLHVRVLQQSALHHILKVQRTVCVLITMFGRLRKFNALFVLVNVVSQLLLIRRYRLLIIRVKEFLSEVYEQLFRSL